MVETLILIIVLAFTVGILWLSKRSYAVKRIKNIVIHNGCLI